MLCIRISGTCIALKIKSRGRSTVSEDRFTVETNGRADRRTRPTALLSPLTQSLKRVIIAIITTVHSFSLNTATRRHIAGPSVITLSVVPVPIARPSTIVIAAGVEIISGEVDARVAAVRRRAVAVAAAVGVVEGRTAVGRSEVAVSVRMQVAVYRPTRVGSVPLRSAQTTDSTRQSQITHFERARRVFVRSSYTQWRRQELARAGAQNDIEKT